MAAGVPRKAASVSFIHADRTVDPSDRDRISPGSESPISSPLADLNVFANAGLSWRRVKRGETAYLTGDKFNAIYGVRSGFFKVGNVDAKGREQVMGFFMRGELFGLEGISAGRYGGTATALEDSEIAVLPFPLMESMAQENPAMQRELHVILSREIARDHGVMMLLGSMTAEERLATFLLNLSKRFMRRGYSPSEFHLRMTREEIGSYLGLRLETVSRLFSLFQERGLMETQYKRVCIVDIAGLERVLHPRS
jgi:CRP/FNR family transcriptional regulator, anaerobic regulatory protein